MIDQPSTTGEDDERLIQLWLHGRSSHTQRAYLADAKRLRAWLDKPLAALTLDDLQDFASSIGGAASTRHRTLSAVKSLLAFGHAVGQLPTDAGRALRLPGVRNRLSERILTEGEIQRMIGLERNLRNRAILTLLYMTGIRVSELCSLFWRDVRPNGDAGQITVFGKGGATRSIYVPQAAWLLLLKLRTETTLLDAPVFRSRKQKSGGSLQPGAILIIVRAAAARAGVHLPVSPHWFRHAHASHALDRGAPIHLVQATLGHASIVTTGQYLHARPKDSSSRYLSLSTSIPGP